MERERGEERVSEGGEQTKGGVGREGPVGGRGSIPLRT